MVKIKTYHYEKKKIKFLIEVIVGTIRNTKLEDLHAGKYPTTLTGDYSDVKVVTPDGEIPWNGLSRISNKEMGDLKDSIREELMSQFERMLKNGLDIKISKKSLMEKMSKEF